MHMGKAYDEELKFGHAAVISGSFDFIESLMLINLYHRILSFAQTFPLVFIHICPILSIILKRSYFVRSRNTFYEGLGLNLTFSSNGNKSAAIGIIPCFSFLAERVLAIGLRESAICTTTDCL